MPKAIRDIFVIMPFVRTPTRGKDDLTAFFENNLKEPIESCTKFKYRYRVYRSDDAFDINKKIVGDIFTADIVLCDLSGEQANPNVMYELGLRLALTDKPVIMFREKHESNKPIFDVSVYHCQDYLVTRYKELQQFVIAKIRKFELGEEAFTSPVLDILQKHPSVISEIEFRRAKALLMGIEISLAGLIQGAGGAIHHFLENSRSRLRPPPEASDLLSFLQDKRTNLEKLDWSSFRFHPNLPPPLHVFLSSLPLNDVTDLWLSRLWNTVLSEYYKHFFGTSLYWDYIGFNSVHSFIGETSVVRGALQALLAYLSADDDPDAKEAVCEAMLGTLSQFLDWKKQGVIDRVRADLTAQSTGPARKSRAGR